MNTVDRSAVIQPNDVKFVVGGDGRPSAVLIDMQVWQRIIEALEDVDDRAIVKQALAALDAAGGDPEQAGFIPWERAHIELRDVPEE